MDYALFDRRGYPTLGVRDGYGEWAESYETVVQDEMDLRLFDRLAGIDWRRAGRVLELACGTGRVGAWARAQGVAQLDGVDFTQAMLARAAARRVYDRLLRADIRDTGLPAHVYDLIVQSLADEHLPDLAPLYAETARLAAPGGVFAIVGYHSHFLLNGMPTHFDRPDGQSVTVESYVHLFSDHVRAAQASGWTLAEMHEGLIDDAWIAKKPKWEVWRHHPVSFAMLWRRSDGTSLSRLRERDRG